MEQKPKKSRKQPKQAIIHYVDENFLDESPCGNKDDDSILADNLTHVTCKDCLKQVFKRKAHSK